jgi:hypothetical protein
MSVDDYQFYWLKWSSPFMHIAVYSDILGMFYRCIGFMQTIISVVFKSYNPNYPLTHIIKPKINFLEILIMLMTFIAVKGTETPSELWKFSVFKCTRKQLLSNFVIGLVIDMPYVLSYFAVWQAADFTGAYYVKLPDYVFCLLINGTEDFKLQ